jgi:hypothetical protein
MENYYTAYTKTIQNKTHFFVKKYVIFPEFKNVAPVLESYGMHTDFDKACSIALITDSKIKEGLLNDIENNTQHAKVIDLNNESASKRKAQ